MAAKRIVLLITAAFVAAMMPALPAMAAPKVALLYPSAFTATQVPEISDKERPVHLVAWTSEQPSGALLEFEIAPVQGPLPGQQSQTVPADAVGNDTWEGFWIIPDNLTDGSYTVTARLYSGNEEIANAVQPVTINQSDVPPPAIAETVEMSYPQNGGNLGFFTPKDKRPNALIRALASVAASNSPSNGAEQVRAMYAKTDPGTKPEWTECGHSRVANGEATIRCTLAQGDSPGDVNAVAVAANNSPPPGPADAVADDGGDAHRVTPYVQAPTAVAVTPEAVKAEVATCQQMTAVLLDQFSRPIGGANLDLHAQGPTDQLRFAENDVSPVETTTNPNQAPNSGSHPSKERTIRCSDKMLINTEEGDHNIVLASDRKHIESVDGTNNSGDFTFALYSPDAGPTSITIWSDENDDDEQQVSEAVGDARIGWGTDPPPPQSDLFFDPESSSASAGSCQQVTLVARQGGSPLVGVNVDAHIKGPDSTVQFCPVTGGTGHAPDQGGHTGDLDPDGSRHIEGTTDTTGKLSFGVTSATEGETEMIAWLDTTDDDVRTQTEIARDGHIMWTVQGARSISLDASSSSVAKGRKVRLFGSIDGSDACSAGQLVRIQQRRSGGGRFHTVATDTSAPDGSYSTRLRVKRTSDFRALTPANGSCEKAKSRTVKVRVR
jgi:hypothetical protein